MTLTSDKRAFFLRRKKLGKTSCEGIAKHFDSGQMDVYRNDTWDFHEVGAECYDYAIRWGCTANIPVGPKVINKAKSIHFVADKAGSREVFASEGLAPATTRTVPGVDDLTYPVVVRPQVHSQGKHVYLCNNITEVITATQKCGPGYYISNFIDKTSEYRVFVAFGRVVWVANKTPADPTAVAWNVAHGGVFENVKWGSWPIAVLDNAVAVMKHTGLDFGGVDVMLDGSGQAYCLEVNSAPSQTSPYRQECVARMFRWMLDHGHDHMDVCPSYGWRGYIHPGVSDAAKI